MRTFIVILFVLLSRLTAAQKSDTLTKYLDKNLAFTNKSGMIYPAIAFPQNGHWVLRSVYPDNSIIVEAYFLDKKLTVNDGLFDVNYPGGIPAIRGTYHNNYRSGIWQSWFKNGQLKDSGSLINDVLTGTWLTYYDNGTLMTRAHFNEQVGSTGLSPLVSGNKNTLLSFPPSVAIKTGLYESWHLNGLRQDSGNYQNDLKTGFWKLWYENGKPESEGSYDASENMQGNWIFYREDGSISTKEKYADNKLSDLTCFDEKGNLTGSFCSIAKPPVLLGTPYDWKDFFETHLVWSKETIKKSGEGVTIIRFTIGKDGKLVNHTLLNSPSIMVTEDIEKVIRLMTDWSPAILHNRPLEYSFDYQVPFYPN